MAQTLTPEISESPTSSQIGLGRSAFIILSALILFVGIALRFYHLGVRSIWYDEAMTANISRGSLLQVIQLTRTVSAPIAHPVLLYLTERVASNAWMARFPSAVASFATVLMMLAMIRVRVNMWAALFAAAILSLSASQIRYAQEVREYSLAVFFTAVLIFCLFQWEDDGPSRRPAPLYIMLFLAPFVQYGLVLLAAAVLTTMLLRALLDRNISSSIIPILFASVSLLIGSILCYLFTLRYQLQGHGLGAQWYLAENYYDPKAEGILHYVVSNTHQLLSFFIPGQLVVPLLCLAGVLVVVIDLGKRKVATITLLLLSAFTTTIVASIFHVYPYGGIRQCLFLAPVLALFAGSVFAELLLYAGSGYRTAIGLCVLAIIVAAGVRGLYRQWPYNEFEDTQSLLRELAASGAPSDQVWVNHDAVAAFRFYRPAGDARFAYGKYYADANDYMPELLSSITPHTTRLWLVFSHLEQGSDKAEEQLILKTLPPEWKLERRVSATNAELYLARRAPSQQLGQ